MKHYMVEVMENIKVTGRHYRKIARYGGATKFEIEDNGRLKIYKEGDLVTVYAPGFWLKVAPHIWEDEEEKEKRKKIKELENERT